VETTIAAVDAVGAAAGRDSAAEVLMRVSARR
jgi:hypothetical protein